jgi:threonine/homoserine/homoserine lactone efflux protein
MIRDPTVPVANNQVKQSTARQWAAKGLRISGLNPNVFLLLLALLPQFIDPHSAWPLALPMALRGLKPVFSCGVVYLLMGYRSGALLSQRPGVAMWVSQSSGALMIVIAVLLIAEPFI